MEEIYSSPKGKMETIELPCHVSTDYGTLLQYYTYSFFIVSKASIKVNPSSRFVNCKRGRGLYTFSTEQAAVWGDRASDAFLENKVPWRSN